MHEWFHKKRTDWVASYSLVSPASTMLIATVVALAIGFATQLASAETVGASFGRVWISETAPPGGVVRVAVTGLEGEAYTISLPGLSTSKAPLRYDSKSGHHVGQIRIPVAAPTRGFCTVRVTNRLLLEEDHKVKLLKASARAEDT